MLAVENPFIAKSKLKNIAKTMPLKRNSLGKSVPIEMLWDTNLEYVPVYELQGTPMERFKAMSELEELIERLPGLDCGSCGAPNCRCFAQDVINGLAKEGDCVVIMRKKLERIRSALGQEE